MLEQFQCSTINLPIVVVCAGVEVVVDDSVVVADGAVVVVGDSVVVAGERAVIVTS